MEQKDIDSLFERVSRWYNGDQVDSCLKYMLYYETSNEVFDQDFMDGKIDTKVQRFKVGLVNHANDPGGLTKYGISQKAYPNVDIKSLKYEQAKQMFVKDYYDKAYCYRLSFELACYVFDFAVNAGVSRAAHMIQHALVLQQDGVIGQKTLQAMSEIKEEDHAKILARMMAYRKGFYAAIAIKNVNLKVFSLGWTKRFMAYKDSDPEYIKLKRSMK